MKPLALFSLSISILSVAVALSATPLSAQEETKADLPPQVVMPVTPQSVQQSQPAPSAQSSSPAAAQQNSASIAPGTAPDKSKIVYVSDFELDALDAQGQVEKNVPANPSPVSPAPLDANRPEAPTEQASKLVDFMSTMLVKELEKAGYTAHRLRPTDDRPTDGIRIRGIFAEADDQNRLRRAVLGTITVAGKMALFVGIGNLARPDQALYAVANTANSEQNSPTVISVSSYTPIAKFEIEKHVTEKAIKDTAAGIVLGLNNLLGVNVVALSE
jgi:hypothetical protein